MNKYPRNNSFIISDVVEQLSAENEITLEEIAFRLQNHYRVFSKLIGIHSSTLAKSMRRVQQC